MKKPKPYKRLLIYKNSIVEAVRIIWPPGAMSKPHDHGISRGTIWVVRGKIIQKVFDKETKDHKVNAVHGPGEMIEESPDIIHIMGNPSTAEEAETFHVYSPPLKMKNYKKSELKYK